MQHVARVLDAVLSRLFRGCEAVVPGAVEIFETGRAVFQVVELTRYDGLLLGHAAGETIKEFRFFLQINTWKSFREVSVQSDPTTRSGPTAAPSSNQ